MDIHRAKQIKASPQEVRVLYHGVPVWIKNCNDRNQTVSIFDFDNPEEVIIVPVEELNEQK